VAHPITGLTSADDVTGRGKNTVFPFRQSIDLSQKAASLSREITCDRIEKSIALRWT
jgi:hypothetical protein